MKRIILASVSPRRKELLEKVGLKFTVVESKYIEKVDLKLNPHALTKKLSLGKAKAVAKNHKNSIIIAADTVVVCKNTILGKPKNKNDAKDMLEFLSNSVHFIVTGFTIIDTSSGKTISKSEQTKIFMREITSYEIDAYVKTGEPLDKAGGYAIQEIGSVFIKKIEGDFSNAVGLPIFTLIEELKNFGIKIL